MYPTNSPKNRALTLLPKTVGCKFIPVEPRCLSVNAQLLGLWWKRHNMTKEVITEQAVGSFFYATMTFGALNWLSWSPGCTLRPAICREHVEKPQRTTGRCPHCVNPKMLSQHHLPETWVQQLSDAVILQLSTCLIWQKK